eukprot:5891480-Pyramimonas_sp.AAC.1
MSWSVASCGPAGSGPRSGPGEPRSRPRSRPGSFDPCGPILGGRKIVRMLLGTRLIQRVDGAEPHASPWAAFSWSALRCGRHFLTEKR